MRSASHQVGKALTRSLEIFDKLIRGEGGGGQSEEIWEQIFARNFVQLPPFCSNFPGLYTAAFWPTLNRDCSAIQSWRDTSYDTTNENIRLFAHNIRVNIMLHHIRVLCSYLSLCSTSTRSTRAISCDVYFRRHRCPVFTYSHPMNAGDTVNNNYFNVDFALSKIFARIIEVTPENFSRFSLSARSWTGQIYIRFSSSKKNKNKNKKLGENETGRNERRIRRTWITAERNFAPASCIRRCADYFSPPSP